MDKKDIEARIESFIHENFVFDESAKPGLQDSLLEHGIVDSTGILELTTFLEEVFAITVEDEEMLPANLDSIKNITDFIARKLGVLKENAR
jgi:acyl carrier protein